MIFLNCPKRLETEVIPRASSDGSLNQSRLNISGWQNNSVMDIGMQIFLRDTNFTSSGYPEVELLDHMVVLFLIFKEISYCFSY